MATERRVTCMAECRYRLRPEQASINPETDAPSTKDHRHGCATTVAALVAEFNAYLY